MKTKFTFIITIGLLATIGYSQNNTFPASGNVGIGVSNPEEKLHVRGGVKIENLNQGIGQLVLNKVFNESANQFVRSALISSRNGDVNWDSANDVWVKESIDFNDWTAMIHRNGVLGFYVGAPGNGFSGANNSMTNQNFRNTFEHLTILQGGNVGVGTINPTAKLHVFNGNNSYGSILANATESAFSLYTKTLTTTPNTEAFRLGLKFNTDENNGFISFYRGPDTYGGYLGFSTNGIERFMINTDGNVGIDTAQPTEKLDVNGNIKTNANLYLNTNRLNGIGSHIQISSNESNRTGLQLYDAEGIRYGSLQGNNDGSVFGILDGDQNWSYQAVKDTYTAFWINNEEKMRIFNNGNVAIGSTTPANSQGWQRVLDVRGPILSKIVATTENATGVKTGIYSHENWAGTVGRLGTESQHDLRLMAGYGGDQVTIKTNGNVAIGTTDPQGYKLAVAGNAIAESMRVRLQSEWPDYVFKDGYKLPALQAVANHIKKHGHLPNIPKAKEVQEQGIDLGTMNAKLLQKIEELTLYVIDLQKQIHFLKQQNENKK